MMISLKSVTLITELSIFLLPFPAENISDDNRCYTVYDDERLSWWQARDYCRTAMEYGDLAYFTSPLDQTNVQVGTSLEPLWIGLLENGSIWKWTNGERTSYTSFIQENQDSDFNSSQRCAAIVNGSYWQRLSCDMTMGFICVNISKGTFIKSTSWGYAQKVNTSTDPESENKHTESLSSTDAVYTSDITQDVIWVPTNELMTSDHTIHPSLQEKENIGSSPGTDATYTSDITQDVGGATTSDLTTPDHTMDSLSQVNIFSTLTQNVQIPRSTFQRKLTAKYKTCKSVVDTVKQNECLRNLVRDADFVGNIISDRYRHELYQQTNDSDLHLLSRRTSRLTLLQMYVDLLDVALDTNVLESITQTNTDKFFDFFLNMESLILDIDSGVRTADERTLIFQRTSLLIHNTDTFSIDSLLPPQNLTIHTSNKDGEKSMAYIMQMDFKIKKPFKSIERNIMQSVDGLFYLISPLLSVRLLVVNASEIDIQFSLEHSCTKKEIDEVHELALNIITYVGCSVSLLTQIIAVTVFTCVGTLNSERIYIHRNLCLSIMAAQITFLAGIKAVRIKILCSVVAFVLHYFYTSVFVWMLVEGLHLYSKVVQVFGTEKSRLIYYCGFGWGVPLILVTISATADWSGYGTQRSCWLSTKDGTIWAFVGPAVAIIVVNMVILWMVIRIILKLEKTSDYNQIRAGVKGALFLLPLLGLTWIFGLMAVNEDLVIFQYLFALFNSLQGFFIFLFHCVFNTEVRQALQMMRDRQILQRSDLNSNSSGKTRSFSWEDASGRIDRPRRTLYKKDTMSSHLSTSTGGRQSSRSTSSKSSDDIVVEDFSSEEDAITLMYI